MSLFEQSNTQLEQPKIKGDREVIKFIVHERVPMSERGIRNWNPKYRGKLHLEVTKSIDTKWLHVSQINNPNNIKTYLEDNFSDGRYNLFLQRPPKFKNQKFWRPVLVGKAEIINNKCNLVVNSHITRRWFWDRDWKAKEEVEVPEEEEL